METYVITDLLRFWMAELNDDFKVIKAIINIVYDRRMTNEEKRKFVLDALRYYGLYEIGYIGDTSLRLKALKNPVSSTKFNAYDKKDGLVPTQTFKCRIMNLEIQFKNILN